MIICGEFKNKIKIAEVFGIGNVTYFRCFSKGFCKDFW
jgi:hypothetical protein